MTWGRQLGRFIAVTILSMVAAIPFCQAQGTQPATPQRQAPAAQQPRPVPAPRQEISRPGAPQARGHAGDWLRRYKDLSPEEQEHALQNDPAFRRLPQARQELLRQRLQRFSNLPPQQQLRVLNRMETWEHLTPGQKQQARQIFGQMQLLPPGRRRLVHKAIDDLRAMPPDQREQIINSDRFKGMFSDQERELMRNATRLPLAPPDSGDQPGQTPE